MEGYLSHNKLATFAPTFLMPKPNTNLSRFMDLEISIEAKILSTLFSPNFSILIKTLFLFSKV